jgi:PAS domain-containing protein
MVNPESLQPEPYNRAILDAIPSPILIVDADVAIHDSNRAARSLLDSNGSTLLYRRGGEALHCIHAKESPEGCGRGPMCPSCVIRNSVIEASRGHEVIRRREKLSIVKDGQTLPVFLLITASPFRHDGRSLILLILEDISEIVELRGLLPICAHCKKVRNDQEYWQSVEHFFTTHMDVNFTHGICPDCMAKHYGIKE